MDNFNWYEYESVDMGKYPEFISVNVPSDGKTFFYHFDAPLTVLIEKDIAGYYNNCSSLFFWNNRKRVADFEIVF